MAGRRRTGPVLLKEYGAPQHPTPIPLLRYRIGLERAPCIAKQLTMGGTGVSLLSVRWGPGPHQNRQAHCTSSAWLEWLLANHGVGKMGGSK